MSLGSAVLVANMNLDGCPASQYIRRVRTLVRSTYFEMNFDRYNCLLFEMNKKVSKHISLKWNKSGLSQSGVQVFPRLSSRLIF